MPRKLEVTPEGQLSWAILDEPRVPRFDPDKPAAWSISLLLHKNSQEFQDFTLKLEKDFAELHGPDSKVSRHGLPWREQEIDGKPTGLMEFRFKRNATTSTGKELQGPEVVDKEKKSWPKDTLIGNGSTGRIAYRPWKWKDGFGKAGMSLDLMAVQVLTHVPFEKAEPTALFDAAAPVNERGEELPF